MNQTEMIRRAAERSGTSVDEMTEAWQAIRDVIADALVDGERVSLTNFGAFVPHDLPEREAWNPHDQVRMMAPAVRLVRFKVSDTLADVVAGKSERTTLRKQNPRRVPGQWTGDKT